MVVYNLTITDLVSRAGYYYTSDQTISKRESNEICSFLERFIADNVEREITKITMFADNCPGQIKNRYIVQMLAITSVKSKLSIIDLIFFEKGHTQNINDSKHSVIERAKKDVNIHHPWQWVTLIEKSCRSNPYKVTSMEQSDFFNYHTSINGVFDQVISKKTFDPTNQKKSNQSYVE